MNFNFNHFFSYNLDSNTNYIIKLNLSLAQLSPSLFFLILGTLPFVERTQKDSYFFFKKESRRTSGDLCLIEMYFLVDSNHIRAVTKDLRDFSQTYEFRSFKGILLNIPPPWTTISIKVFLVSQPP